MPYCMQCGAEISKNAKFCPQCGCPVETNTNLKRQNKEYAGKIYKCPNCGEIINSFEINCPACGYELRGTKPINSIVEFTSKLESFEEKCSNMEFQKKINFIKSFPVPITKEDMLEFMILAISNIDISTYDSFRIDVSMAQKELNSAWLSKAEQVYQKAMISCSNDDTFLKISQIFNQCKNDIKKIKRKSIYKFLGVFVVPIVLALLFAELIHIGGLIDNTRENRRLNNIVVEVQAALDRCEYSSALKFADSIDYQYYNKEMEMKWDIQREYWVDKVIEEASKDGISLEYEPTPDVDKANYIQTK